MTYRIKTYDDIIEAESEGYGFLYFKVVPLEGEYANLDFAQDKAEAKAEAEFADAIAELGDEMKGEISEAAFEAVNSDSFLEELTEAIVDVLMTHADADWSFHPNDYRTYYSD